MRRGTIVVLLAAAVLFCPVLEAKDEGFYLGVGLGLSSLEQNVSLTEGGRVKIDDTDYAYKLFGGYQLSPLLAVEGGLRNLGTLSSGRVKTDFNGIDAFAVAGVPLGPVRLFGKLGGIYGQSDTRIKGGVKFSNDGFDLGAGAGLEFELGSFGLRGEAEYFDALDGVWMYSVGATFTF